jgi:hypothetical protein
MAAEDTWISHIDAAKEKELDTFRLCLRAYACAVNEQFSLPAVAVEEALREDGLGDGLGAYLIAKQQEIAPNMTIVDLIAMLRKALSFLSSCLPSLVVRRWPKAGPTLLSRIVSGWVLLAAI